MEECLLMLTEQTQMQSATFLASSCNTAIAYIVSAASGQQIAAIYAIHVSAYLQTCMMWHELNDA